jgi:MFS-type transporter involved in bile tolerance (Atg22 family)
MIGAGAVFILTKDPILLMVAAIIGVISPSGNEIGPFLSVEQAGLTQLIPDQRRTQVFAWYNLSGSFATASGALAGGWLSQALQSGGISALDSYRTVLMGYALGGVALVALFLGLSAAIEAPENLLQNAANDLGLHR